jgi:hypothetical protein
MLSSLVWLSLLAVVLVARAARKGRAGGNDTNALR